MCRAATPPVADIVTYRIDGALPTGRVVPRPDSRAAVPGWHHQHPGRGPVVVSRLIMATRTHPPREATPPVPASSGVSQARLLARLLDDLIAIPGTKIGIGLDPVIGLIPGLGDVLGGAMSGYILLIAARAGAPTSVLVRMLGNIALDSVVGLVPVVGDLFDVGMKANRRNVDLLERFLGAPGQTKAASRGVVALILLAVVLLIAGVVTLGVLLVRWLVSALG